MTVFNVSNAAELTSALKKATGGDEVRLEGGDYGLLRFDQYSGYEAQFDTPITIVSANSDDPATFSSMWISNANNIVVDGVNFDYNYKSGDAEWVKPFQIESSSNITIKNSEFQGDTVGGVDYATGLFVRRSSDITLEDNEFSSWKLGVSLTTVEGVKFTGNEVHSISRDGMNIADVQNILIEDNYFHDFNGANDGSHRDMIQFWTQGTNNPTTDVVIRGNTLDIGDGSWTQSIFIRNEEVDMGRAGSEMYYRNILIEDNVIYNSHTHGITVGETDGLTIKNNSVIHAEGDPNDADNQSQFGSVIYPTIRVTEKSKNVVIESNLTTEIAGYQGQSGWSVNNNTLIQDKNPNASGYYADIFGEMHVGADGSHNYVVAENSALDHSNIGAAQTQPEGYTSNPGDVTPPANNEDPEPETPVEEPEAPVEEPETPVEEPEIPVEEPETQVEEPEAPVEEPEAPVEEPETPVNDEVPDEPTTTPDEADFADFSELLELANFSYDARLDEASGRPKVNLDGKQDFVALGRLEDYEDSDQLTVSVEFTRNDTSEVQERLVWNHQKFGLALEGDGLRVLVANDERPFWEGFKIHDLGLNDTESHSITVTLDSETDQLQVVVDGDMVFETSDVDLDVVANPAQQWGWTLGSAWNHDFDGQITNLSISDEAVFADENAIEDQGLFG